MKTFLLAGGLLASMTAVAAAADLPSRVAPPIYTPAPMPLFTWTGAYFGVNAGYAFDHEGRYRTNNAVLPPNVATVGSDGFTGGGQIGYNYQFGGLGSGVVVGLEVDAAYMDTNRARTIAYGADGSSLASTVTTYRSGLDYLGTVRGRVGYAFGQFLVYGTGGFAYGGLDNRMSIATPQGVVLGTGGRSRTETGYVYGGGIEYALPLDSFLNVFNSSAVTLKAEYLHYDLGMSYFAVAGPTGYSVGTRVSNKGDLARLGLNFKFGSY